MKKVTYILTGIFVYLHFYVAAQDTIPKNPSFLFLSNSQTLKQDSAFFKTPRYKQGVICDFEDQLNRKKVPINFQLGNSKY